jgi:ankyrin repeat protein
MAGLTASATGHILEKTRSSKGEMMKHKALILVAILFLLAGSVFADGMMSAEELFFQAVREGNTSYVKNALNTSEVNIDITNSDGWTPIMVATDGKLLSMVVLLLGYKPDLEVKDPNNRTVFDIAEDKGNVGISNALAAAR